MERRVVVVREVRERSSRVDQEPVEPRFFEGAGGRGDDVVAAELPTPPFDIAKVDVEILRALWEIKDSGLKRKLLALITSLPCDDVETGRRVR